MLIVPVKPRFYNDLSSCGREGSARVSYKFNDELRQSLLIQIHNKLLFEAGHNIYSCHAGQSPHTGYRLRYCSVEFNFAAIQALVACKCLKFGR